MVELRFHPGKNRLYVSMSGDVTEQMLLVVREQFALERERFRPGVDVINDVSGIKTIAPAAVTHFAEMARLLTDFGVKRVVRVVGRSAEAAILFERASRDYGLVAAFLAFSLDEAERLLDGEFDLETPELLLRAR